MPEFKVCAVDRSRVGGPDDTQLLDTRPRSPRRRPQPPPSIRGPTAPCPARPRSRRRSEGHPHATKNRFLQGIYTFEGAGIDKPAPLHPSWSTSCRTERSPRRCTSAAATPRDELITVVLIRDGVPMRYFPIGAKGDVHVPLRVVEDLEGGTAVELHLAAPAGLTGSVIVDLGMVEV